jgi:hypothetical protein
MLADLFFLTNPRCGPSEYNFRLPYIRYGREAPLPGAECDTAKREAESQTPYFLTGVRARMAATDLTARASSTCWSISASLLI